MAAKKKVITKKKSASRKTKKVAAKKKTPVKKACVRAVKKTVAKKVVPKPQKILPQNPGPNPYVTIRRSKIHGNGMFAKRDIPKGTKIIEYVGNKLTKAQSDKRAETIEAKAKKYGSGAVYIFTLNKTHDIDGSVSWNKARFMNHACETNCESDIIRGRIWVLATRDIKKGEELHYDYGYDLLNWQDHPCRCGKGSCVGYIVTKSKRARLKKLIEKQRQKAYKE
jgi:SET domain-containing protein